METMRDGLLFGYILLGLAPREQPAGATIGWVLVGGVSTNVADNFPQLQRVTSDQIFDRSSGGRCNSDSSSG